MSITNEFKEAVEQEKTTRVRIILKDSLLLDPSGSSFDEMYSYAKNEMDSLTDEHDGEEFKPEDSWNDDYLNEQMVNVIGNFSEERINLLKKMVKKIYESNDTQEESDNKNEENYVHQSSGLTTIQKAGIGVAAVGAVALAGGLALEAPMAVPIVGGAVAVVGASMIILGKNRL